MTNELFGLGSVVTGIWWWSTPDKYDPPRRFENVAAARAHGTSSVITVELALRDPDGTARTLVGEVPAVAPNFRLVEGVSDTNAPRVGAVAIELVPRHRGNRAPRGGDDPRCEDRYEAIIFRNPDGALASVRPWLFPDVFRDDQPPS
jgi:hypothetical protein